MYRNRAKAKMHRYNKLPGEIALAKKAPRRASRRGYGGSAPIQNQAAQSQNKQVCTNFARLVLPLAVGVSSTATLEAAATKRPEAGVLGISPYRLLLGVRG